MIKRDIEILIYIRYLSGLGSSTGLETVLESSGNVLQVSHSTGTGSVSSLSLLTPVVRSSLSSWVTTGRTGLLLNVEGTTTTSVTQSVGLVVTLTERWSTLYSKIGNIIVYCLCLWIRFSLCFIDIFCLLLFKHILRPHSSNKL